MRDAISDAANRMVLNGAKQILLFNLPDLGQNPSARSQKVVEAASHVSAYHNQLLLNWHASWPPPASSSCSRSTSSSPRCCASRRTSA